MNKDSGEGKETLSIDRAHAIGTYGKLEVRLGQMNEYSDADNGMIFDTTFSGATVRFGNVVKAKVAAHCVEPLQVEWTGGQRSRKLSVA